MSFQTYFHNLKFSLGNNANILVMHFFIVSILGRDKWLVKLI